MKHTVLLAALASLGMGASVQADALSNQEIYATFGEETYLSDSAAPRVDMASMEIGGGHQSSPEYALTLSSVHEIFGEERVGQSLPRADMAVMEIRGKRGPATFDSQDQAYSILDIDV